MNKGELIDAVVAQLGAEAPSKAQISNVVKAIEASIAKALNDEGVVQWQGLANFKVVKRAARTGRNPATGETIQIAARNSINIKASTALTAAVADKK